MTDIVDASRLDGTLETMLGAIERWKDPLGACYDPHTPICSIP
jgi:hypothetical protein